MNADRACLRADFQRFYGHDITFFGPLFAADLAVNLPPEAMIWRHVDERTAWSDTNYLLADILDDLNFIAWRLARWGSKNNSNRPKPIPRPGEKKQTHKQGMAMPLDELKRFLASPRKNIRK